MKRTYTFEQACAIFPHRYTMQYVPRWARIAAPNGKFYAPQYATDAEWYANTLFNRESDLADATTCYSHSQTWPLGQWLDEQYKGYAK